MGTPSSSGWSFPGRCPALVFHSSVFHWFLLQIPSPPLAHISSSQLQSYWMLSPDAFSLLSCLPGSNSPFSSALLLLPHIDDCLPSACPAHSGTSCGASTQPGTLFCPFSGPAAITTAELHYAHAFTSLYRNIQWCFTRL